MARKRKPSPRRRAKRTAQAVVLALLVLLAVGLLGWVGYTILTQPTYEQYEFDTAAMEGRIQQMTQEEIQAELNRVVEEGMFNISIASGIVFESPTGQGEARIENVAANRYHMQVDIILDDTQERVYASKLIRPGYSIEFITLDKPLPPGEYNATAIFSAITQQELQVFGTAGAQVKLYVLDDEGNVPR